MRGTIEDLKDSYGFINSDSGGKSIFFHSSEVTGNEFYSLQPGDVVQFTPVPTERGPKATQVQIVDSAK